MRAVIGREVRELLLPALAVWVALACLGTQLPVWGLRWDCSLEVGAVGAGFGLFQGVLDRHRRHDVFLLHRPLSAVGIHGARTGAGLAVLAVGVVVAAGAALLEWAQILAREADGWYGPSAAAETRAVWGAGRWGPALPFGAAAVALAVAQLVAGWAVTRFGASRRHPAAGVLGGGALGFGAWAAMARATTVAGAAGVLGVVAAAVATWTVLDLAGERR